MSYELATPVEVLGNLCFCRPGLAFFTTAPLQNQWGDDWDDAPWEHNAGSPYSFFWLENVRCTCLITTVRFECETLRLPGHAETNSRWSVKNITRDRVVPWLSSRHDNRHAVDPALFQWDIWAGFTFQEFLTHINGAGGEVLWPIKETP